MKSIWNIILVLLLMVGTVKAQELKTFIFDDASIPREHLVDFTHCLIDISIIPQEGSVKGFVKHTFRPLRQTIDSLYLDGPGIEVASATFQGEAIEWKSTADGIIFHFDNALNWEEEYNLTIHYEAHPEKGMYFIGWQDSTNRSRKQIWTQGQGIDNRYWFPHFDHLNDKLITETKITFDENYKVLSNGALKKQKKNRDGTITWHYEMSHPHASYLVMIGIGKYTIQEVKSESGVPIQLYYYPEWEERVPTTYQKTVEMFNWFEDYIGVPYPWENYSQIPVQDYLYGAMENTTSTIFGDFFFTDKRGFLDRKYVYVNAHEFAHQWFGDMVTARSSEAHWLHESFATYYHGLWHGQVFGENAYQWMMRNNQITALGAGEENDYPIRDSRAGSARHYMKGAFVLKMLNNVLGEEQYRKVIEDYLVEHPFENVDTEDLLTQIHESLGLSLNWFFDQWVYRGGEPHYKVNFVHRNSEDGNSAFFLVEQMQAETETVGLFKMPIQFEVHLTDGQVLLEEAWIEKRVEQVHFKWEGDGEIDFVLFDPNNEILKKVEFEKKPEWLMSQSQKAKFMLDRYDAVKALENVSFDVKKDALQAIYDSEDFYAIDAEIARQIMNEPAAALEWKQGALKHPSHEVRRAALTSMRGIPANMVTEVEAMLTDSSYSNIELALDKLVNTFPQNAMKYLNAVQALEGNNHKNIRLAWLKYQWLLSENKSVYEAEIADYAGPSFEFITRQNAASLLEELNIFNRTVFANLVEGALNQNRKLRGSHRGTIKYFSQQFEKKQQMLSWLDELNLSDEEKDRIKQII